MKHISLSHDPSLAKKYVRSIFLRTVSLWNFSSQIDVSHNPIGDFFRHFISNVDSSKSTHRQKPSSHHLAVPSLSLILLWQISLSNQLGQMEVRHGLHMISPKVELPNNEPETNNTIHYELIYSAMVEHAFPKCLFLPVQLKIFNRMNEQVHLHLQLLRYSELVFIAINRLIFLRLDQHWMQIHCCPHVVSGQEWQNNFYIYQPMRMSRWPYKHVSSNQDCIPWAISPCRLLIKFIRQLSQLNPIHINISWIFEHLRRTKTGWNIYKNIFRCSLFIFNQNNLTKWNKFEPLVDERCFSFIFVSFSWQEQNCTDVLENVRRYILSPGIVQRCFNC